jgi:hypothetical protein
MLENLNNLKILKETIKSRILSNKKSSEKIYSVNINNKINVLNYFNINAFINSINNCNFTKKHKILRLHKKNLKINQINKDYSYIFNKKLEKLALEKIDHDVSNIDKTKAFVLVNFNDNEMLVAYPSTLYCKLLKEDKIKKSAGKKAIVKNDEIKKIKGRKLKLTKRLRFLKFLGSRIQLGTKKKREFYKLNKLRLEKENKFEETIERERRQGMYRMRLYSSKYSRRRKLQVVFPRPLFDQFLVKMLKYKLKNILFLRRKDSSIIPEKDFRVFTFAFISKSDAFLYKKAIMQINKSKYRHFTNSITRRFLINNSIKNERDAFMKNIKIKKAKISKLKEIISPYKEFKGNKIKNNLIVIPRFFLKNDKNKNILIVPKEMFSESGFLGVPIYNKYINTKKICFAQSYFKNLFNQANKSNVLKLEPYYINNSNAFFNKSFTNKIKIENFNSVKNLKKKLKKTFNFFFCNKKEDFNFINPSNFINKISKY